MIEKWFIKFDIYHKLCESSGVWGNKFKQNKRERIINVLFETKNDIDNLNLCL